MANQKKIQKPSDSQPAASSYHLPVLLQESIDALQIRPGAFMLIALLEVAVIRAKF